MAATIVYNRMAAALAMKLGRGLPILGNTRQQASDRVFNDARAANGETMLYVLPDRGVVGHGGTITEGDMSYAAGSVPLTLHQYNISFSAGTTSDTDISGAAREANEIEDFKELVEAPLAAHLASEIQGDAADVAMLGSASAQVISGTMTMWDAWSEVAANIRAAYSGGDMFAAVGPRAKGVAARGAANQFNPAEDISKLWREATIGRYTGATFFETPDVRALTTGTCDLTAAGISVTSYTAATNTLVIGATSLTGTIKKGTVLYVGNVRQTDVYGKDTGAKFAFVVQENATCSSNAATLTVQPVYTSGAKVNATAAPQASDAVVSPLGPSKIYQRSLMWDRAGIGTGFGRLADLKKAENFRFELLEKGLFFHGAEVGDGINYRNIWRLDMLTGTAVTLSNWVGVVFVEV